jgi:hypothetical protein
MPDYLAPELVIDHQDDGPHGRASAVFNQARTHRQHLTREWDPDNPKTATFLMLNPSVADAFKLDPTVTRCVKHAKRLGAGRLEVVNLFDLRSTDPKGLRTVDEPSSAANDRAIVEAVRRADIPVAAWGTDGTYRGRDREVLDLLAREVPDKQLHALGTTKDGHPRHPLYVRSDAEVTPYTPPAPKATQPRRPGPAADGPVPPKPNTYGVWG